MIVGLLHQDIGHLGIFVSGKVAKKEHAQIVSVLKSIEALPPGLYGMEIHERKDADGTVEYEVEFDERRLEEIAERLNRFERADEKPFEAVAEALRVQPARLRAVRAAVGAGDGATRPRPRSRASSIRCASSAGRSRTSIRGWRGCRAAAEAVKAQRRPLRPDNPARKVETLRVGGHQRVARLLSRDPRRDQRGRVLPDLRQRVLAVPRRQRPRPAPRTPRRPAEARELPFVKEALASIAKGGFAEALTRTAALLAPARRAAPARAPRAEGGARRRLQRAAAGPRRATSGGASAASRTSSSATSRRRRSRRCPALVADRPIASAC